MPSQVVNLKISGLQTNDQYLSEVPAGALLKCINFNHDRQGILEKRRGFFIYGDTLANLDDRAKELFSYKGRVFRHYVSSIDYDDGNGTFTQYTSSITEPSDQLRIKTQEVNGNLYLTSDSGIRKIDARSADDLSNTTLKDAGGVKALQLQAEVSGTTGFLLDGQKVGYKITWANRDNNNNLIIGSPSQIIVVSNTSGNTTNVKLQFPIPNGVTLNSHFYQIYRSQQVLNSGIVEDELNLTIEDFPTTAQIVDSEIIITDITPDDFRAGGAPLHTNALSGEGIAQANEPPPRALDITLFKNFTFYANTKTRHNFLFNLLSVDDLYDGESKLVIYDQNQTDTYTFDTVEDIGNGVIKRETSGTVAFNVQETANSIVRVINGNSTGSINAFYESGIEDIPGQVLLEKRNLADVPFSISLIDGDVNEFNPPLAIVFNSDSISASNPSLITTTTNTFDSTVDVNIGTDTITVTNHNYYTGQEVLSGGTLPTGLTTSALYYVVRVDSNNFQLTTTADEARQATPTVVDITATVVGSGTFNATHGYITGDTIKISDSDSTPNVDGEQKITFVSIISFTIDVDVTVAGTTATFFKIDRTQSTNEEKENRIYYSKLQQPEAVPSLNFIDIGPQDKAIKRIIGLRDSLFIMKEDGVYRLSGESPSSFVIQQFDSSAIIIAPDSAAVLNNQIYALTSQGIVLISDTGVQIVSKPIENILNDAIQNANSSRYSFAVASESDRAYYLWTTTTISDTVATQCFRYNSDTQSWTTWDKIQTCGVLNPGDDTIYLGASDVNNIEKERKNRDRTDHADRKLTNTLDADGISDGVITGISDPTNISDGDVISQDQYLTIAQYNQLLRQLDLDNETFNPIVSITQGNPTIIEWTSHELSSGDYVIIESVLGNGNSLINDTHQVTVIDPNTFSIAVDSTLNTWSGGIVKYAFESNLECVAGNSMLTKLVDLTQQLQTYFSNTFIDTNSKTGFFGSGSQFCFNTLDTPINSDEQQVVFNFITDRLNQSPEFRLTNYSTISGFLTFEEMVVNVDRVNKQLTLFTEPIFLSGNIDVFKAITSTVQWVPNHADDPSLLKRIIDAAVIVDNQSFTTLEVKYSTDLSQGFDGNEFIAEGIGMFGQTGFGQEGFGGVSSSSPIRTIVPRDKSRCRYISPRVRNFNAREQVRIFGFNLTIEITSQRAYRGKGIINRD